MQKLIDKLVLFGLCLLTMSLAEIQWLSIVTMLGAVAVSSLCSYFENKLQSILCASYVVLCLVIPGFVVFLPLIVYDCADRHIWPLRFCWLAALPACLLLGVAHIMIAVPLFSGVAFLLQYRTTTQTRTQEDLFALVDDAKEQSESLERKNRDLMEKQDYDVRLATLAERNRIAREIHDNVGHLLTRSLLQISALFVTNASDEKLVEDLNMVKSTLSDAMDSVRSSVHNLHDESVDLKNRLQAMVDSFEFCPVKLRFDAGELPADIKYCFAAIVREALSNIARHSNASEAVVTVTEHPAFCQLTISDNGTAKAGGSAGIGLQNMADRVEALGGVFRTDRDKGFRIFISVPLRRE